MTFFSAGKCDKKLETQPQRTKYLEASLLVTGKNVMFLSSSELWPLKASRQVGRQAGGTVTQRAFSSLVTCSWSCILVLTSFLPVN